MIIMNYPMSKDQVLTSRPASLHSERSMPHSSEGEPPRKRVRKGTKSCWECKRRKVRCQLSSEDVPVCSGCLTRGTTCLSQEYPEEREASSGNQLGERLGRVEQLLETLVAKITAYEQEENTQKVALTPDSLGNDVLTPFSSNGGSAIQDKSPFLSLFDNTVIRRDNQSHAATPMEKSTRSRTPSCRPPKIERIRQALIDLLPSQQDTNLICGASSCWLLVNALSSHAASVFEENNDSVISSPFNLAEVSKRHPTIIARTILYIANCLQQLDPQFDASQLRIYPSIEARMDKFLSTVQTLITSDDELVSTMEGLECLVLQGIYYINAGSPRRAWLTFRRALNIGQLMGIHRKETSTSIPGGREMFHQITQADRYLALLLGLPAGTNDDKYEPEENFQNPAIDKDLLFTRKLSELSGRIIERNQADQSHAYATSQEIDEKLEALSKEMPSSWWDIPGSISAGQTELASVQFDRLMTQIWYFQLEALLHLPFMLRAATERRYDYSKFSCLKASRQMMYRYLSLRSADNKSFCCKVVDFAALTATVTLFLGLLEPIQGSQTQDMRQQQEDDRTLIHTVLGSMEQLSQDGKDVVASQSVNVIKSLLAVDSPENSSGNLRLTIPYFGTISIVRPAPSPSASGSSNIVPQLQSITIGQQMGTQAWQGIQYPNQNPMNVPTVSFTSSQFPPQVPEQQPLGDLGSQDSENLFFDSLLNTDLEGNWIF